ncbi:polysaccharide deacetylase family protein [Pararobbsia alpina]|jgi:peptidoglycan-N-acetylglucosamine deacetylase|uniref:Peptidoglycan-N-acetylmuramic acid deacetylase PdaC n=1 Tax=Pararobbsia alpina TaxID=621374 RepID=A0A6S7C2K9_9BURK|nr:polysaccharide deacetylase family protein [Pararobbsia alpina]CAB3807722.1 Peptidoglycan-N-acetylmuramic acid deacetylase PdaC [Pararobbsia alpina]
MKKITLTFDNGPTPGVTESILAILAERGIKTTFFVMGNRIGDPVGAALLDKIVEHGHWVGNHSFTHSVAFGDSTEPGYALREIGDTQALIAERGISERLFRPFGNFGLLGPHLLSEEALAHLIEHRFTCIAWNSVPHDWDDQAHWVERCLSDVAKQDWTVVVLHDIEDASLERLTELLDGLAKQGIEIVQSFPEEVVLIRDGEPVSLKPSHVAGRS